MNALTLSVDPLWSIFCSSPFIMYVLVIYGCRCNMFHLRILLLVESFFTRDDDIFLYQSIFFFFSS
jgi:hypothetical protein